VHSMQILKSSQSSGGRRCILCWQSEGSTCHCGMLMASSSTRLAKRR